MILQITLLKMSVINFTENQRRAFETMKNGENVLITGPAGTGKSFLIDQFRKWCDENKKTLAVTSTTGVSALLIGGTTLHSWAGIGLGEGTVLELVRHIRIRKKYKQRWIDTKILIIDEISMMDDELFDKLDQIGRKVRGDYLRPFGGLQIILSGDFCQLPPVKTKKFGDKDLEKVRFCFESKGWEYAIPNIIHLTEVIRQSDPEFRHALNELRMGIVTEKTKSLLKQRLITDEFDDIEFPLWFRHKIMTVHEALKNIINRDLRGHVCQKLAEVEQGITNPSTKTLKFLELCIKPTQLFAHRASVKRVNLDELRKLKKINPSKTFESKIKIKNKNEQKLTQTQINRYVEKVDKWCQAENELEITIGSQVMLICNLNLDQGLANGSRGVVIGFTEDEEHHFPIVRFMDGKEIVIEEWSWEYNMEQEGVEITFIQIPLILADAVTIHKSQGSTLDMVETDLGKSIFEYGQFYTALSRVRTLDGLYLKDLDFDKVTIHPKVEKFYQQLNN